MFVLNQEYRTIVKILERLQLLLDKDREIRKRSLLARTLHRRGTLVELPYGICKAALSIFEPVLPPNHPALAIVRGNLVGLRSKLEDKQ